MNLFNKIIVFMLLTGFYVPTNAAAVDDYDVISCSISDTSGDKKDGKKSKGEEEPDCE